MSTCSMVIAWAVICCLIHVVLPSIWQVACLNRFNISNALPLKTAILHLLVCKEYKCYVYESFLRHCIDFH